jgi:PAS domain S-box-containing protein
VSDSFLKLTGLEQPSYEAMIWTAILHPEDSERVRRQWVECVANGRDWEAQVRVKTAGGDYRAILSRGVAMRDDAGKITGWAGMNLDIDRLKSVEN